MGAALHLSRPHVTIRHLPAAVMSTALSLSVGDGTSKNKCRRPRMTRGGEIEIRPCHKLSLSLVDVESVRKRQGTPPGEDKAVCQDDFSHACKQPLLLFLNYFHNTFLKYIYKYLHIHKHQLPSRAGENILFIYFFFYEVKPEGNFAP